MAQIWLFSLSLQYQPLCQISWFSESMGFKPLLFVPVWCGISVLFNRNTFLAQSKLVQKLTFTNSVPKMVKRSSLKKILNQKMTKSICDESAYILLSIVSLKPYFPKCLTHKPKKTKMFHTWHISPSVFKVCKKVSKNNKIMKYIM